MRLIVIESGCALTVVSGLLKTNYLTGKLILFLNLDKNYILNSKLNVKKKASGFLINQLVSVVNVKNVTKAQQNCFPVFFIYFENNMPNVKTNLIFVINV